MTSQMSARLFSQLFPAFLFFSFMKNMECNMHSTSRQSQLDSNNSSDLASKKVCFDLRRRDRPRFLSGALWAKQNKWQTWHFPNSGGQRITILLLKPFLGNGRYEWEFPKNMKLIGVPPLHIGKYCLFALNKIIFFLFSFLCLIWHVIERYGWKLYTVQRWASNF